MVFLKNFFSSFFLFVIVLLFILYFCLWCDLINSVLVKCLCVDVTDPSLFMFTKISIDSGHGVASLFSSSLSLELFLIFALLPQMLQLFLCPWSLFLSSVKMEATLRCSQSLYQAVIISFLAGEHEWHSEEWKHTTRIDWWNEPVSEGTVDALKSVTGELGKRVTFSQLSSPESEPMEKINALLFQTHLNYLKMVHFTAKNRSNVIPL